MLALVRLHSNVFTLGMKGSHYKQPQDLQQLIQKGIFTRTSDLLCFKVVSNQKKAVTALQFGVNH